MPEKVKLLVKLELPLPDRPKDFTKKFLAAMAELNVEVTQFSSNLGSPDPFTAPEDGAQ